MVVNGSVRELCSIFARLCKEAGGFDDRSHGADTGVGVEGARWIMGVASVGPCVVILVRDSVGRILGREWRRDVGRDISQR